MAPSFFLTVLLLVGGASAQRNQIIRFFLSNDCKPAGGTSPGYEEYRRSGNVTRSGAGFNSYCVMSGAWRVQYEFAQTASDFNITVGDYCSTCIYKGQGNNRQWGVAHRIVGSDDLTRPSLSLYPNRDFIGNPTEIIGHEYTFQDTQSFSSFAFTSFGNYTWRIYFQPRWRGNSSCYSSSTESEVTLVNPTAISVGSVRLGCNASPPRFRELGFLFTIIFALGIPSLVVLL